MQLQPLLKSCIRSFKLCKNFTNKQHVIYFSQLIYHSLPKMEVKLFFVQESTRQSQCRNLKIFLPLRFSVKAILLDAKYSKASVWHYLNWFHEKTKWQKNSWNSTLWITSIKSQTHELHKFAKIEFCFYIQWNHNSSQVRQLFSETVYNEQI